MRIRIRSRADNARITRPAQNRPERNGPLRPLCSACGLSHLRAVAARSAVELVQAHLSVLEQPPQRIEPNRIVLAEEFSGCRSARFTFVLEPEALAFDRHDDRVVQGAVEHRRGEYAASGEGTIPTAESEIRGEIIEPRR